MLSHVLRCFCKSKPAEPHRIVRRLWNVTSFTESCAQMSSRQFGDGSCTSSTRCSVKGTSHDVLHCHHERLRGRWSEKCKRAMTTPGTDSIVDTLTLDLRGSLKAFRTTLRSYVGWSRGGDAARRGPCRHVAIQCCDHLHRCPTVACSPKHSSLSHSRPVTFLTYPFPPPQGAQLVSRNPSGFVNETIFGHPSSFTRKSASRRRMPVVTANVTSPHAFVCFYTLFFAFFFSLSFCLVAENLALRLADACIHQCSTCVQPPWHGSPRGRLFFVIYCAWTAWTDMRSQRCKALLCSKVI